MCMSFTLYDVSCYMFFRSVYVCLVVYTTIYQPPNDMQHYICAVYEEHVKAPSTPTLFVAVNLLTHPSHRTAAWRGGILPSMTLFYSEFAISISYILLYLCHLMGLFIQFPRNNCCFSLDVVSFA